MNACPYNKFVAVSTEQNDELTNLILFELDESNIIKFRDEMNFYNDHDFNKKYNYIRDMSLAIYHSG